MIGNEEMIPKNSFRPGDKLVLRLLKELDELKTRGPAIKPAAWARQSEALIRSCMQVLKDNMDDHLIVTTTLWVLVSLSRLEPSLRALLADVGIPGVLSQVLQGPRVSKTTREYASELTRFLIAQPRFQPNGSIGFRPEGDLDELDRSFNVGGSLGGDSISENSSSLAQFVPYQLNAANADTLNSLFPKSLAPSRGGATTRSEDHFYSLHRPSDFEFSVSTSPSKDDEKIQLPYVLRGSGHAYEAIMHAPYASEGVFRQIEMSADGRRRKKSHYLHRESRSSDSSRRAARSSRSNTALSVATGSGAGGARALSRSVNTSGGSNRFPDLISGGSSRLNRHQESQPIGYLDQGIMLEEGSMDDRSSYDPRANFADMTSSLAKLDPLCLSLSVGLHAAPPRRHEGGPPYTELSRARTAGYGDERDSYVSSLKESKPAGREESWISFAERTITDSFQDYDDQAPSRSAAIDVTGFSSEWRGHDLSHSEVFNTAPEMTSEHLIDTAFVRQLFVDGTTVEEAQNLVFKMQGVFELFDKDCTGVVDWNTFTKLILALIPERVLRADAVHFIAAQAEDPTNSIDYREFCHSGKVVVIEYKESAADKKALSTLGWQHRQQAVTGDVSTYTWKNHVQWYRDRKSQSLIWLMRRASRAVLSFRRHLIAADYLAYQGERARSLGFLMECGDRALAGTDVCTQTALDLASKAQHSRKFIALRKETQRVLCKLGEAAVKAVQAEYDRMRRRKRRRGVSGLRMVADDARAEGNKKSSGLQRTFSSFMDGTEDMNDLGYSSDEEEKAAAQKRKDELIAMALRRSKANPHEGYNRIHERYYKTSLASKYLFNKGIQAIRLGYNKDDALAWLMNLGARSCGQTKVTDKVYCFLAMKGQEAIKQSEISDNTFISLCKTAKQYIAIYNNYLAAQSLLHKVAVLALRTERDVGVLMQCGKKWLRVCNERDRAFAFLEHRRDGALGLINRQRAAVAYLQSIPRKIWANIDRIVEAEITLKTLGKKAISAEIVHESVAATLKEIARKGIRAYDLYKKTWAHLEQIGQSTRRQHFEKHWAIQSYNKPLIKEEEARVIQQDKDNTVIRRGWTREERLKAEFEDAFEFLGVKPQKQRLSSLDRSAIARWHDGDSSEGLLFVNSRLSVYQISKMNFIQLTINGKLLGGGYDPSRVFDSLDTDQCGYIGFEEAWGWVRSRLGDSQGAASSSGGGLFGKKTSLEFSVNDILPVKSRVIMTLFEKYEGRNSRHR